MHKSLILDAIIQLVKNAADALGRVQRESCDLVITTRKISSFIELSVFDNGSGIKTENIGKIFDPFFTTKEMGKGSGLGLDVVSRIMLQHNGEVKVNSAPGATEFEICLPI